MTFISKKKYARTKDEDGKRGGLPQGEYLKSSQTGSLSLVQPPKHFTHNLLC